MKKIFLLIAILVTILVSGCAKGEITLEISRWGAADLSCQVVSAPVVSGVLNSFKDDFKQDGYIITDAKDGDMVGFLAQKHYNHLQDIKDSKVLETFRFSKIKDAAKEAQKQKAQAPTPKKQVPETKGQEPETKENKEQSQPLVKVQGGWLMDTVTIHTGLNLANDKAKNQSFDEQFIMRNILKSIGLKFNLKLPVKTNSNNATTVSEDGKTLTWVLPMGENTPIDMDFTYVNPIKAMSWLAGAVIIVVAGICVHSYKKSQKFKEKMAKEYEKTNGK
ncbi:MAG: hypothetical protein LKJ99_00100 [Acidaminococcaceae bacterium]|jgi:hypothetical protein|nr:hypothetical protein [Acidaminococcaceae bacterium]